MRAGPPLRVMICSRFSAEQQFSALDGQVDQTALDVDLLDQLLAFQRSSHCGVGLGRGDGSSGVDV